MRKSMWVLAAALALSPAAFAGEHPAGHEHPGAVPDSGKKAESSTPAKGDDKTVEGNIVDMACYLGHGDSGGKHAKCAKACVVRGTPAGVLGADGTLYLLVEDHDNPKAYDMAKKLAGEKAKVTGKLVEKGGIKALIVAGAEKGK